jgi:hypothetical protein
MASFSRKTGIVGALVIASVLIVGAYFASSPNFSFFSPNTANAESTQALLKAYAQKSSAGDGLPDWEAVLYGLDPHNPHSFSPDMTNAEAVARGLVKPKFTTAIATTTDISTVPGTVAAPDTLTDQFAQNLFNQYISQSNGTQPSDADIAKFAQDAIQSLVQNHAKQDIYTQSDVRVSGEGPAALTAYAVSAEAAFAKDTTDNGKSGIDYFAEAVEQNKTDSLKRVASIGKSYAAMPPTLIQMNVPKETQYAHREIANALVRIGADFTDMSMMDTDPLRAYLGLAAYDTDSAALTQGFADMNIVFKNERVTFKKGEPGYDFYSTTKLTESP